MAITFTKLILNNEANEHLFNNRLFCLLYKEYFGLQFKFSLPSIQTGDRTKAIR